MAWFSGVVDAVKEAVKVVSEAAAEAKLKSDIQAAQSDVQAKATNFRQNGGEGPKQEYIKALDDYLVLVAYDMRKINDQAAIDAELARLKAGYQGSQAEKNVLFPLLDQTAGQVKAESPEQRELQVEIHDAIGEVETAQGEVQGSQNRLDGFGTGPASNVTIADARIAAQEDLEQDQGAYSVAVANLIGLELEFELTKIPPAGPNGGHTQQQWEQAGDAVKKRYRATGEFANFIDQFAVTNSGKQDVQGWLDKINNDPGSLGLTPAEQELAKTDPISLAFLKAAGVKLDPNDPTLSPEMKAIAEKDPVLFGLLQMNGVKIWTDGTPPEGAVPVPVGGKYIYITIGDNPRPLPVTTEMARQFEIGGPADLATMLIPQLKLQQNPTFMRLAPGADILRGEYVDQQMKTLMSGDSPQTDAAIKMLGINLPQFFSPHARAATWESSARPVLEPLLRVEFDKIKLEENMPINFFLTSMGRLMNKLGEGAPPEVHRMILDLAMGRVNQVGAETPNADQYVAGENEIFLRALTNSVQIADQLPGAGPTADGQPGINAEKVARWMFNSTGFQPLYRHTPGMLWGDIKDTGNTYLADALVYVAKQGGEPEQGFASELEYAVTNGKQDRGDDIQEEINKQNYLTFLEDPKEILEPFFDGFLNDSRIGHQIAITSDAELRNVIGKTLGLPVANTEAANNLDYSVDWYEQGTVEWNIIITAFEMIKKEGGDTPKLTALPTMYTSEMHGINNGGLFVVIKPDGDDVVIDGAAARNGVLANGGAPVSLGDQHDSWKFADFKTFQEDNRYDDDGEIYIPRNFVMQDADGDGHADYDEHVAAITTLGERIEMGVGIAGAVVMFVPVPGAQALGLALLATSGLMSLNRLSEMEEQGQSRSWSNPAARAEYMNLIGTGAVFLRFPAVMGRNALAAQRAAQGVTTAGRGEKILDGTQKFLGVGATYVGFTQTAGAAQNLIVNWGNMSWDERGHGLIMVAAGMAQMRFGAKDLNPRLGYRLTLDAVGAPRGPSWRMNQLINQRANQLAQSGSGTPASYRSRAWDEIRTEAINKRGDELWAQANNPQASKQPFVNRARQEFDAKVVQRTDTMWQDAGSPAGKKNDYRDSAEYAVFEDAILAPMSRTQQLRSWATNIPPRTGEYARDLRSQWTNRHGGTPPLTVRDYWRNFRTNWAARRANPNPAYGQGWQDFKAASVKGLKGVAWGYGIANGGALLLEAGYYYGVQERRSESAPVLTPQNAEAEMQKFLANPDQYLNDNYENAFFGFGIGDRGYNLNGHLLSFTKPDGTQVYFRRAPESLNDAYEQALEARGVDTSSGIFVDETIKLADHPDFDPTGISPQDRYFTMADTQFGADIGEHAYQLWLVAGKPGDNATSGYWLQVEKDFATANGQGAYDAWLQAGRKTTGADQFWADALRAYQPQIQVRATELWNASGRPAGSTGPLPAHLEQAEKEFGDEIGTLAYDTWVKDGNKPGGGVYQHWTKAQSTFESARAQPAFDRWQQAGKPGGDANEAWTTARDEKVFELWTQDGQPVDLKVEIRAPWRETPLENAFMGDADGGVFGRWRGTAGIGPVESWRPHVDAEATFLYSYNQPNVSTVRVGLPSPTQGYGVGIRQQDTTIWAQLRLGGGAASYNRQHVYDLTSTNPGEEWTIMDGRAYLAFGNRNRIRVDYAGRGTGATATWKHDKTYLRIRETGFMELGLGMDFVKYAYGDESLSFNGYYELQLYAPDFRAQWNITGDGSYTRGMQGVPPFFEIDPALQFSTTEGPRIADVPILSGEER